MRIRRVAAHLLAFCVALGPAALVDCRLTAPALEASCASSCADAGTWMSSYARSWSRGQSSVCVCERGGSIPFDDTTWWALVEVGVFFASIPLALWVLHVLAPEPK